MRLIDRDKIHQKAMDIIQDKAGWKAFAIANAIAMAEIIKAEPVKHGEWNFNGDDGLTCSVCGKQDAMGKGRCVYNWSNYCPNCGAKMDGGTDNGNEDENE